MDAEGEAKSRPCSTCPWRVANFDGYPPGHHAAVLEGWSDAPGIRDGGCNTCHSNRETPCAGTVVLQHRELLRFLERGWCALTREGLERVAARTLERPGAVIYGFVQIAARKRLSLREIRARRAELVDKIHPAIADERIGHPLLDPPSPREAQAWQLKPSRTEETR